jgi:hypothetical protein
MGRRIVAPVLVTIVLLASTLGAPPAHAAGLSSFSATVGGYITAAINFFTGIFSGNEGTQPTPGASTPTPTPHIPDLSTSSSSSTSSSKASPSSTSPATAPTKVIYRYLPPTTTPALVVTTNVGVSESELTQKLAALQSQINAVAGQPPLTSAGILQSFALTNAAAGNSTGATLNAVTVNGVRGLAASDIPSLAYLPIAGGTVSGNLTVTGAFSGGALSLANASTTLLSVLGPAYFGGTATSTFGTDGSLTLAKALGIASGGTGTTTFGQGWLYSTGGTTALAASSSPTVNHITATSTTEASTFAGPVILGNGPFVDVTFYGADPTGVRDSAPAFRSAVASNRKILVPPGTYLFSSTQSPPCCAQDNAAVLVQGLTNFEIDGYGATIIIDPSIVLSSAFAFDQDTNFVVRGLTIHGSRNGLSAGQENVGIAATSDVGFRFSDMHFTGNFGGEGAAYEGDWLVNAVFENTQMDTVGQCADTAFLANVTFRNIRATGADTNAATTTGSIGDKCISIINDNFNTAANHSGLAFSETTGVTIDNVSATNFSAGANIASGLNFDLSNNHWYSNPGLGAAKGLGVYIHYINGGSFSSVGVPPQNITIHGDTFFS